MENNNTIIENEVLPVPESEQRVLANLLRDLNETYPDKIITRLQQDHKKWYEKVTRLYKNIGYATRDEFLEAYGFKVEKANGGKGGRPSSDLKAIVEELVSRYEGARFVNTIAELKGENPDLSPKFKNIQNKSKELFGMSFVDYLVEKGVMAAKPRRTTEEIEADRKTSYADTMKEYDTLIQEGLLGWKPLPMDKDTLLKSFGRAIPKKRYNNAIKELAIDEDKHFADLGVLADGDTDNELRELIQCVDFRSLS